METGREKRGGAHHKSEELLLIEDFLETDKKNMCFTYETKDKAYNKYSSLHRVIKRRGLPLHISVSMNQVFIERK